MQHQPGSPKEFETNTYFFLPPWFANQTWGAPFLDYLQEHSNISNHKLQPVETYPSDVNKGHDKAKTASGMFNIVQRFHLIQVQVFDGRCHKNNDNTLLHSRI
jgi:hypothetical protein